MIVRQVIDIHKFSSLYWRLEKNKNKRKTLLHRNRNTPHPISHRNILILHIKSRTWETENRWHRQEFWRVKLSFVVLNFMVFLLFFRPGFDFFVLIREFPARKKFVLQPIPLCSFLQCSGSMCFHTHLHTTNLICDF